MAKPATLRECLLPYKNWEAKGILYPWGKCINLLGSLAFLTILKLLCRLKKIAQLKSAGASTVWSPLIQPYLITFPVTSTIQIKKEKQEAAVLALGVCIKGKWLHFGQRKLAPGVEELWASVIIWQLNQLTKGSGLDTASICDLWKQCAHTHLLDHRQKSWGLTKIGILHYYGTGVWGSINKPQISRMNPQQTNNWAPCCHSRKITTGF